MATKVYTFAPALARIAKANAGTRASAIKSIWAYINSNNLKDAASRTISADANLKAIFAQDKFMSTDVLRALNAQLTDPTAAARETAQRNIRAAREAVDEARDKLAFAKEAASQSLLNASPALAAVIGRPTTSRNEALASFYAYVAAQGLKQASDASKGVKAGIVLDDKLKAVFADAQGPTVPLTAVMGAVARHLTNPAKAEVEAAQAKLKDAYAHLAAVKAREEAALAKAKKDAEAGLAGGAAGGAGAKAPLA